VCINQGTQGMVAKRQEPICFSAQLTKLKNTRTMFSVSHFTMAWHILRLQMEHASRYGCSCKHIKYAITDGKQAAGAKLTNSHHKKPACHETLNRVSDFDQFC
jgi:hypothetical protein